MLMDVFAGEYRGIYNVNTRVIGEKMTVNTDYQTLQKPGFCATLKNQVSGTGGL
jgi:hypothetical protein